ncbi:hypothetical protein EWM64_g8579 [Hericium alpestre]|uniref:6-phosphofructokinase n=1 Tax=Hericium alpestre TaxID=135208 RepID=A0A4Y9ZME3_9AGAM|nr:hypothetical protein EWM64_g8579 [Hericium alpestre]
MGKDKPIESRMKLAVLTSGGDSAGMNAAVRAVVKGGILKGCETWIVREGYEGLVRGNTAEAPPSPDLKPAHQVHVQDSPFLHNLRFGDGKLLRDGTGDHPGGRSLKGRYIVRVGWDDVMGWFAEGGTLIGTARSTAFRTPEGRLTAAHNLIKEGIDALVVIGGDGSLTGADVFRSEWPSLIQQLHSSGKITDELAAKHGHLKIVGLVGSIDNDMSMTDMTIGAPTALHRICEAIDNIHSTAISHSRAFVIEVMGRHCGWLALVAGIRYVATVYAGMLYTNASSLVLEQTLSSSRNGRPRARAGSRKCVIAFSHRKIGKRKSVVIVAEGAIDRDLNPIHADYVKDVLAERLGLDTRVTTLGHPTLQGLDAVDAILESTPSTPSYMIGVRENKIIRVPLMDAVKMTKAVADAISNKDFDKAISLRDTEFRDSLQGFHITSALETEPLLPPEQRMRIAIMQCAGRWNECCHSCCRPLLHSPRPHPIRRAQRFRGLLEDSVNELSWLGVENWIVRGGSELGTNRTLPDVDIDAVATKFQEHGFQALMMVGGFEAFNSLLIMENARKHYPAFHIPMVHLPATISNNVPMTEFSLGSDTSLNALVDACDAIKQSASASRNRVFVVETQGGKCGYLATMGALAVGACIVYTPERGIDLHMLRDDVKFLKNRYKLDVKGKSEGRVVIRCESSSSVYTTDVVTKIFKEEGGTLFDSRSASLGHTLQGGTPSPMDRARAVRLALKCVEFIEKHHEHLRKQSFRGRHISGDSAAVITIQGSSIQWVPAQEMAEHADMKNRRGKHNWWDGTKELVEALVARPQLI